MAVGEQGVRRMHGDGPLERLRCRGRLVQLVEQHATEREGRHGRERALRELREDALERQYRLARETRQARRIGQREQTLDAA